MDVVVGMERPELVPAFPVPIKEPREGGHWCLDQITQGITTQVKRYVLRVSGMPRAAMPTWIEWVTKYTH